QPANGLFAITRGATVLPSQPTPTLFPYTTLFRSDSFTYTITPGSTTATVTVTVDCVDDAPVAVDDSATVTEDAAATSIDVLANDTDTDGGPKSMTTVTQQANGTVEITNGGADLTY